MAFTQSTKRAIDYTVPSLAAFAAVWWFITKSKDRDVKFIVLVLLLVFVMAYAITTQTTKAVLAASQKKNINVPLDNIKIVTDSEGKSTIVGSVSSENITQITQALRNDIYDTSWITGHDTDLWWKVSLLSDSDIAAVQNQWNKDFYDEYSESLLTAIKRETFTSGLFGGGAYYYKELVIAKLTKLGAK